MMRVFMDLDGAALDRITIFTSHILLSKSNAWQDAEVSAAKKGLPLLVLSPGLKACPEIYTAYCEYFASIGYVVASPSHTDGSCPENYKGQPPVGRWDWDYANAQVRQRAKDVSFVADHLKYNDAEMAKLIDWQRLYVCGHSFGGATTVGVLKGDERFKAGVAWDSWMWSLSPSQKDLPMEKQVFFMNSEWYDTDRSSLLRSLCS